MLLRTLEAVLASAVEEVLVLLPPERPDMAALLHPLLESPAHALLAAQVQQMFDKAGPMN